MSMYRFSKGSRLFVQGTREQDDRDNVASSGNPGAAHSPPPNDLQTVRTRRASSTEVLGSNQ